MPQTQKEFTGFHALAVFGGAFSIIISVNLALAYNAVASFPGVESKNSYIASQTFDARRSAQNALEWTVKPMASTTGISLSFKDRDGQTVPLARLTGRVGRPTTTNQDTKLDFVAIDGTHWGAVTLTPGRWTLWVEAQDIDANSFARRFPIIVKE